MKAPVATAVRHVVEEYKRFLRTSYRFYDEHLNRQFEEHLQQADVVVRGPIITLTHDFQLGKTLRAMADDGVISADLLKARWPFGAGRLFVHQEQALRTGAQGRPYLVTTGTGSGKTECFLLPILDHCIRFRGEAKQGVKAILLYPMNALANDQLDRLRRLLRGSGLPVSFALYTGDSEATAQAHAEAPAETERLTRRQIRANPPDILLTNYKQLEFLLVRKEDRVLFGPALHFLVLDELHSYRGALATEVACLVRRLKAHAGIGPGSLVGIGTSATVSQGAGGAEGLAKFASDLFGEPFRPDDAIAEAYATAPDAGEPAWDPPVPDLSGVDLNAFDAESDEAVVALAERLAGRAAPPGGHVAQRVRALLHGNGMARFLEETFARPSSIGEILPDLRARFPDRAAVPEESLRREVESYLLVGSTGDEEHPPRLRPKFHTFFHGIYDVGICLDVGCRTLVPHGSTECPKCRSAARPAAICRTCGQDFVKVRFHHAEDDQPEADDTWISSDLTGFLTPRIALFAEGEDAGNGNGGEAAASEEKEDADDGLEGVRLCPGCGRVGDADTCLACARPAAPYRLLRGRAHTCPACGSTYTRGDIITPLRTGTASTVSVLAGRHVDLLTGEDRKLLLFADNRQDAAHQAGYTADRNRTFAVRHLIERDLRAAGADGLALADVPQRLFDGFRRLGLIQGKVTKSERDKWLAVLEHEAASEFCRPTQLRISLENLGLAEVRYEFLADLGDDPEFQEAAREAGLDREGALTLVRALLDRMRRQRGVDYPFFQRYLDPAQLPYRELQQDPYGLRIPDKGRRPIAFALDRPEHIRKSGRLEGFIQENPRAGRLPALQRLVHRTIADPHHGRERSEVFLRKVIRPLRRHEILEKANIQIPARERVAGLEALQIARRVIRLAQPEEGYRCTACQVWRAYPFPVCPTPHCESGKLVPAEVDRDHYYVRLYAGHAPQRMAVVEHSAQVSGEERAKRETAFKEGRLDVMVCTPTLELGVDIGPLLTVILRNAPPTPANYTQRVGRAGRRLRIGFVSTFCGPGAHDRHAFEDPGWLVAGEFRPPLVRLSNPRIVQRHLRSHVLERLEAQLPRRMGDFLDDLRRPTARLTAPLDALYAEVEEKAAVLVPALAGLFARDRLEGRTDRYGEEEVRPIVETFRTDLEQALDAWWERVRRLDAEYREYSTIGSPRADERKAAARKRAYFEITQDPERAYTLNYLATAGQLPAYQFPMDTFALDPGVEDTPTLYRSAAIAIEEFAPGNMVYANGHKLLSIRVLFAGGPGRPGGAAGRTDLEASGRVRTFYFCPRCDFVSEEVRNNCANCGAALGEDVAVAFLQSFEAEEFTRITSDEEQRERRLFVRRDTLLEAGERPCRVHAYPFAPVEYRPSSSILITNWGRGEHGGTAGERFKICPECGRHRLPHPNDEKGKPSPWDEQHARYCRGRPELVVLGYQFSTDVLALSVAAPSVSSPEGPVSDQGFLRTLLEALLVGATEHLEVEPGEISGFIRQTGAGGVERQMVFYETVPGGAGYLEEIATNLPRVAEAAHGRLYEHDCRKACYRCLKRYGNQRWHVSFDKERVRDLLFHLSQEAPLDGIGGTTGQGRQILATTVQQRGIEVHTGQAARQGQAEPTPIERALLEAIRRLADLPEPVWQHEVRDGDRLVTVPDYAYPDRKIAVFCDGYMYHGNIETLEADAQKRNFLQAHGWVVLTFWGRTILRFPDRCAQQIADVYRRSP